jgi:hypothetical protein
LIGYLVKYVDARRGAWFRGYKEGKEKTLLLFWGYVNSNLNNNNIRAKKEERERESGILS